MRLPARKFLVVLSALALLVLAAFPAQAQLCDVLNELGVCTPAPPPNLEYTADGRIVLPGVPSTAGPTAPPAPSVPTARPDVARSLFDLVNQERARVGAPALTSRGDLEALAAAQTRKMLGTGGGLLHNLDLLTKPLLNTLGALIAGENVGWSNYADDLHPRFMASAEHREVLLDPRFNVAGFAVIQDTDGLYYATEDYIQASGAAPAAKKAPSAPADQTPSAAPARPGPARTAVGSNHPSQTPEQARLAPETMAPDATGDADISAGGLPGMSWSRGTDGELAQGAVAGLRVEADPTASIPAGLAALALLLLAAVAIGQGWWWRRGRDDGRP